METQFFFLVTRMQKPAVFVSEYTKCLRLPEMNINPSFTLILDVVIAKKHMTFYF